MRDVNLSNTSVSAISERDGPRTGALATNLREQWQGQRSFQTASRTSQNSKRTGDMALFTLSHQAENCPFYNRIRSNALWRDEMTAKIDGNESVTTHEPPQRCKRTWARTWSPRRACPVISPRAVVVLAPLPPGVSLPSPRQPTNSVTRTLPQKQAPEMPIMPILCQNISERQS